MAIIRPRLIDFYNIPITQEEVDFAIPFLDEDIPLYLDPFLLWKSPSQQDNALHLILINSFNKLGATYLKNEDKRELIAENLAGLSECSEVGLGSGKTKKGLKISINTAKEILDLFNIVPQYKTGGFSHFEEIQLYVNNISKDRISDFACNFLKSFLIDFTQDECKKYNIPVGLYFYSYANSKKQAIKDAKWIIKQIKDYDIDLPIAYDWEDWTNFNTYNVSFYELTEIANAFMNELKKSGYDSMLYSSKNYLENIWLETKYKTWLAHYTEETNYTKDYYLWQLCENGEIDGIDENVDIDIMYLK